MKNIDTEFVIIILKVLGCVILAAGFIAGLISLMKYCFDLLLNYKKDDSN